MASAVSGLQSERFIEKYFYFNSISTPPVEKKKTVLKLLLMYVNGFGKVITQAQDSALSQSQSDCRTRRIPPARALWEEKTQIPVI